MGSSRQHAARNSETLFRLPFGEHRSSFITDEDDAEEYFRTCIPSLKSIQSRDENNKFYYKFTGLAINRISLAATSGLKLHQACGITDDYVLTIPIFDSGNSVCKIDNVEYGFSAKRN